MIKRETVTSLLVGFLVGALAISPVVAGDGFGFGPAQGAASGGGGGSGDLTAVTETGSGLTITSGTGPVPNLALEAGLEAIAGLSKTDGNVIVGNGSTWVAESGATARTSLGLAIGTNVQAYDEELADVAGVTPTDNSLLTGSGSALAMETLTSLMDSAFGSTRGQILYRNATVWTVLAVGTAGQVLESGGAGADVAWGTDGGGSALFSMHLDPRDGISPPGTSALSVSAYGVRNGHPCQEYPASEEDSTQDDSCDFVFAVPQGYDNANNIVIQIVWSAEGATSGNVVWIIEAEVYGPAAIDLDSDSFDTAQTVTTATSGTDGNTVTSTFTLPSSSVDGAGNADLLRLRVTRNSNEALDTLAVRAQVYMILVYEEAP